MSASAASTEPRPAEPTAQRPHMPGYGVRGPDEGSGLLPWSWAVERLESARNFWLCTVRPDGRPHAMPVWGAWDGAALLFSSSAPSRKILNLRANPQVVVTTEGAEEPVVIEGHAEILTDGRDLQRFIDLVNSKYATRYRVDFLDPEVNATVAVRPQQAFGLAQGDFTGSPTRWSFVD
ncbi:PPOX class probable F420-dependent enzyme/PPOX class probable F420-dependent enzyme [Actinomadura pelletieri DSM 43383]|uniref:PPOX class probable F420-dependent enzyme/PPOX class probable F420-dependent enzyme n=1 Tax=Actinomadura pelletieri DSM 43383 TaxID=1120940 RepID=A0A495QAP9_9ACTN|nr:pyridoxamine 5'-phosphate oxidase family protein [Actinomadura pelletieri]RKS68753.1 PPOX class probable F420-dependent enzyme/PPOX class probable F420-dependent enzyme [Actinomadura pelletieri DSM 43383]